VSQQQCVYNILIRKTLSINQLSCFGYQWHYGKRLTSVAMQAQVSFLQLHQLAKLNKRGERINYFWK